MAHRHLIAAATDYIERGWPVFILGRSKRPVANCQDCRTAGSAHDRRACECVTCHGFYAATLDVDQLAAMLRAVPYGFLAIRTGAVSGLLVVDIDPRHGGAVDPHMMTPTRAIRTGGDGWHLYYQYPGATQSRPLPGRDGVDIKADSGYVVAPPSLHPETRRPYRLAADLEVQEVPAALRAALAKQPTASNLTHVGASARTARKAITTRAHTAPPLWAGGISHPDKLLEANLTAVASAPVGSRRRTLYGAARGIARMVKAGALGHTEAIEALTDAGRAAEQDDRDIRSAITGGFRTEGLNP